ncbi:MAG TPA: hypothetical protein VMT70_00505 [Vicinamibacteria bacterium]|nr:hypothetical protein [Vicinamibacteria bacterium]
MKTGRLLKFHRPGGDVHAYLYSEGQSARAVLYLLAPGKERDPLHEVSGASTDEVETEVRAWVDAHYPRPS